MFFIKKIITALVLPPTGPALLALVGLWLNRQHRRLGKSITILAVLSILAMSLPIVSGNLMRGLETDPPISDSQLAGAQAIVILGGGIYPNAPEYAVDTVSSASLERVRYGSYLQRKSGLPVLVSGGAPFGGRPEAEAMAEACEREFHGQVKWIESESRDTADNAVYSARILMAAGITRIALVSHAWHLKRAVAQFRASGIEVFPAPTAFSIPSDSVLANWLPGPAQPH